MNTRRPVFLASLALLSLLLAASCNNSFGAFSSIKREVAQSKTSDFKQTTVADITLAFGGASARYYARMATLYSRSASGGSWSSVSLPGLGTSYACTGMAYDGTNLYVAATSNSDNSSHVFYSSDGTWSSSNTLSIAAMGLVNSGSRHDQITGLWVANNVVYAQAQYFTSTGTTTDPTVSYTLFYNNVGAFAATSLPSSTGNPYMSVGYSGKYCAANGASVYPSASVDFSGASPLTSTDGTTVLGLKPRSGATSGLFAWTATHLYYFDASASGFIAVSSPSLSTDNFISDVAEVPAGVGVYDILVGTGTTGYSYTANGYWEGHGSVDTYTYFAGDSSSANIAPSGSTSTYSTLFASKPVVKFFYDATNSRLFAGIAASGLTTSSYGLVSITNSSGTWDTANGWSAE